MASNKILYPYAKIENRAGASVKCVKPSVPDRSDLAATLMEGMAPDKEKIPQMFTYSSIEAQQTEICDQQKTKNGNKKRPKNLLFNQPDSFRPFSTARTDASQMARLASQHNKMEPLTTVTHPN